MNRKFILRIVLISLSMAGFLNNTAHAQITKEKAVPKESNLVQIMSYGLLTFNNLPDIETLELANVKSLNFVNETTIYAHVYDLKKVKNIEGFESFEPLPSEFKLNDNMNTFVQNKTLEKLQIVIYLPADLSQEEVNLFCYENALEKIENEYLPHYVIVTETDANGITNLKEHEWVSWMSAAPDCIKEGKPFHFCPGASTAYGPKGEFHKSFKSENKYNILLNNEGWDGPGKGCANVTFHFLDAEAYEEDVDGNSARSEVIRAIRIWEKYISVNFSETDIPGLEYYSMDIQWSYDVPSGALAIARGPGPEGPFISPLAGDIDFNKRVAWKLDALNTHLFTVALHEVGHTLGLDHSDMSGTVMSVYEPEVIREDLTPDDIAGVRSLYKYRDKNENEFDKTFVGNVNSSKGTEIVMVNTSYTGGAIRVDDMISGDNLLWIDHCDFHGWMDNSDKMFLADANGDGYDDLILVNTDYVDGAIRVIDLNTGANLSWINHGSFGGWMDSSDKMFVGNMNESLSDELIFVNTDYVDGAILSVNMITGAVQSYMNHTGTFNSWMDPDDRMLLGDANGDNEDDLILINTSYAGGAIQTIDISSGTTLGWLDHDGSYSGWMGSTDRVAVADIDGDLRDELILVNTSYTGGAIRALDLETGTDYSWLMHEGAYNGWMDDCDRMFIADVNNDSREDLVLVNTEYLGGAIQGIDISSGTNLSWISHGSFAGWMDGTDRMFCEDVNADGYAELIMVNTNYFAGAIRPTTVASGTNLSWLTHTGTYNGWMDGFSWDQNCISKPKPRSKLPKNDETTVEKVLEKNELHEFRIYPIPANYSVNIECFDLNSEAAYADIYNIYGEVVIDRVQIQVGLNQVDLSKLSQGTYFVRIVDGDFILHQKIQVIQ